MVEGAGHGEIGTGVHSGEVQVEEITVEEAARNAEKQPVEEERVPTPREVIRNFPVGHVDEVCFPLLNSIALVHPETFVNFRCRSLAAAGSFLTMLYDSIRDWNQTPRPCLHSGDGTRTPSLLS
ncbi:hypothetical protein RHGRI_002614 [Rhododendron griersonianum]|uniref:Uncharacterized protein n=1 Tax=Rhododendron griersonianum TaxID=479676 RepID=A0AAV6LRU3_9ERIC|nr:hypothetical protein RHGRI_002614 [Rhododendron griersonianum]